MTAVLEPPAVQLDPQTPDTVTDLVELYRGGRDRLVRYAGRWVNGRDGAEDAVQDAFVRLLAKGGEAKNPAALLTAYTRGEALHESTRRSKQAVPVGEAMDWQPDTSPAPADVDTDTPCVGDPATVRAVEIALGALPAQQARAVRLHFLEGLPPSKVAEAMGVHRDTAYKYANAGFEALRAMKIRLPGDEPHDDTPAPSRSNGRRPAATDAELVATLAREFPGRWVSTDDAGKTLRRVHGSCAARRASAAQKAHNALVGPPAAAPKKATKKATKAPAPGEVRTTPVPGNADALEGAEVPPAVVEPVSGGVTAAEVWLMGAKPPISCMVVNADETTTTRDLAAVSMAGAQREITGHLIAAGYRPDGPWVDVDPAAPEAMRKFQREAGA